MFLQTKTHKANSLSALVIEEMINPRLDKKQLSKFRSNNLKRKSDAKSHFSNLIHFFD